MIGGALVAAGKTIVALTDNFDSHDGWPVNKSLFAIKCIGLALELGLDANGVSRWPAEAAYQVAKLAMQMDADFGSPVVVEDVQNKKAFSRRLLARALAASRSALW